jgi:drug/metabolite transporter (DMT)-like permease
MGATLPGAMSGPAFEQLLVLLSAVSFALANTFISKTSRLGGDKGVMFSVLVTMGVSAVLRQLGKCPRQMM